MKSLKMIHSNMTSPQQNFALTLFSPNPEATANMSAVANAQVLAGILILYPAKKYRIKTFPPLIPIPYFYYILFLPTQTLSNPLEAPSFSSRRWLERKVRGLCFYYAEVIAKNFH